MQVVIDIDENLYTRLFDNGDEDVADMRRACVAIRKGTPLPKGHGKLKDADNIKTAFPGGEYVRTESVRATIEHEETIIEADTAESEDKG